MSDTCITYYTQYTQLEPPVRQIGLQGPVIDDDPNNTWITSTEANEYDCLGLVYYDTNGNLLTTPRYATLKELKDAGLIRGKIDGSKICYCINELEWNKAKSHLNKLFESKILSYNCC